MRKRYDFLPPQNTTFDHIVHVTMWSPSFIIFFFFFFFFLKIKIGKSKSYHVNKGDQKLYF